MANVAFGHLFACSGIANSTYYAGIDLGMSLGPIVGGLLYGNAPIQWFYPLSMLAMTDAYNRHARRMAAVCGYGELRSWADSVIGRKARKPAGHAGQVHFSNGARIFNICCL